MEKLMPFKEWVKKVYNMTHVELFTKPYYFQQAVNNHYQEYLKAWEEEEAQDEN